MTAVPDVADLPMDPDEFDRKVEAWHTAYADPTPLHEFCGLTRDQLQQMITPWRVAASAPVPTPTPPKEHRAGRWNQFRAMMPIIPPGLRPAHALAGYAVLWEVEKWERAPRPPGDPALLKWIGGDLYAVLAVWDLTDVERAVLAGRTP